MEKNERIRVTIALFEVLVRRLLSASFRFPGGASARRVVDDCLKALQTNGGGELSDERLTDFCICQAHAISRFDGDYLSRRWFPSHSFGAKARARFAALTPQRRYHEDRWLESAGLSRALLPSLVHDRREHPLWQFLNPAYEENTKNRVVNTPVCYYVCGVSTLLWNPFSAACRRCLRTERCRKRTAARYPELYRLRCEESERRTWP